MEFPNLKDTPIFKAFSDMGKEIFQPNGIFYWAGRSKKEADINATVGTAMAPEKEFIDGGRDKLVPMYIPELKEYVSLEPEKFVSYAPMQGVADLRKLWADWIIYKGKVEANLPSGSIDLTGKLTTPIMCSGITNAIFLMVRYFLNADEVIISPEKRWGNYNSIITRQNGIKIEDFNFFKDDAYNTKGMIAKMEEVADKQGKVVLILNFPNNPTGYCPTPKEITDITASLKEFCEKKKDIPVVILCDDAYEGYVYTDERVSQSIFYELVGLHKNLIPIKMDGTSKEMLMYGGRVAAITLGVHDDWISEEGFGALNAEWENKTKALVRSTISNINHYAQEVLVEILKKGSDNLVKSREPAYNLLKKRFQATMEAFNKYNTPNLTMDPAGGGFFVFINIDGIKADELAGTLLEKYKLGTVPIVNAKAGINGIRLAYCSIPDDKMDACFDRIDKAVREAL